MTLATPTLSTVAVSTVGSGKSFFTSTIRLMSPMTRFSWLMTIAPESPWPEAQHLELVVLLIRGRAAAG